jgi:hypothetical protein
MTKQPGCVDNSGIYWWNSETDELRQPFCIDGVVSCLDVLWIEHAPGLGEVCYDEGDYDSCEDGYVDRGNGCEPKDNDNEGNDNEYRPIDSRCTEQEIKENKYRPEVGGPCDPVSFCEDRNTTDPTNLILIT